MLLDKCVCVCVPDSNIMKIKLESIYIYVRGNDFDPVSTFSSNREFNVRVNSTYSNIQEQVMEFPQRCILSATLFSIKINSLVKF